MLEDSRRERAESAGWEVEQQTYPTVRVKAELTGVSHVTFVLLKKGWVCDSCGRTVNVSQFSVHAKRWH